MMQNKWGRIINIASVHGLVASPKKAAYVAANHGVIGLTKVTALETTPCGVTCNAICPEWVKTPLVRDQIARLAQTSGRSIAVEELELVAEKMPTAEFGAIADMVLFLCGESAAQITGSAMTIDGGWTAQ